MSRTVTQSGPASTAAAGSNPPVDTIRIKVDGREVDVPKTMPDWQGKPVPTTMLQACQIAGIEVPHYCYHSKLPVAGNCRMCLIEIGTPMMGPDRKPVLNEDGSPKIMRSVLPYEPTSPRGAIACASPISPGMELYPSSEATQEMREAVLESLLINHPLDCPICDQAGECKLQEYSVEHGQSSSRFAETKVHKPKAVDLGPRIMLDDERCILCTRCIRFTRDVVGDDALGIVNRGSYNSIGSFPGSRFDNNYTLNTVDLCPVGALTSKDFRFKMRVWFLKETRSICTDCGTGCNITIGSREGVVYRYEPRGNDAVNAEWMCDAGRLNYRWIGSDQRETVLKTVNAGASWAQACAEVAEKLAAGGAGTVAVIAGAGQTTEELYLASLLARRLEAITDSVAHVGEGDSFLVNADKNPNTQAARLIGICGGQPGERLNSIADGIRSGAIRSLVVIGEDVTACGLEPELLKKLEVLVALPCLKSPTSGLAHYVIPGCAFVEKRGTFINVKGRLQKVWKAVEPRGDARPEVETLQEILRGLGVATPWTTLEGLFNQMAKEVPAFAGLEWARIGETGVDVAL